MGLEAEEWASRLGGGGCGGEEGEGAALMGLITYVFTHTTRLKKKAAPYFELMNKKKKSFEHFSV